MLSARELALEQNPSATGWVNQRIIYTHGIGVAMVPVNEAAEAGPAGPAHREPAAGVGRRAPRRSPSRGSTSASGRPRYVVTGARQDEFDYPTGDDRLRAARSGARPLDGDHRDRPRHDAHAPAVRGPVPGPRPAHQRPGHGRQPAPVPSHRWPTGWSGSPRSCASTRIPTWSSTTAAGWSTSRTPTRPPTGSRTPRGSIRPLCPGTRPGRRRLQLHPQQRQDHDGRLRRHDALLRRGPGRPDHPRLRGRLPDAVRAARRDAGRPPRPPAGPRGAVQRPDPDIRPLPRHRPAAVLPQGRPVDRAHRHLERRRPCRPRRTTS